MNPWLSPPAILGYVAGAAALVGYVYVFLRWRINPLVAAILWVSLFIAHLMIGLVFLRRPELAREVRRWAFGAEREGDAG